MNFLAHLYLSGDDPQVMVGNFIGDFVKGRDLAAKFGAGIARGVELHRLIDEFTDRHAIVRLSKQRLRPKYRHYSPVIVDIFYDHFLAAQWSTYSDVSLEQYSANAYQLILDREAILPERVNQMLPYMMRGNWLLNYGNLEGIRRVFEGMSRRASFDSRMDESVEDLRQGYAEFQQEFDLFFPELARWSARWLTEHPAPPGS